MNLPKTVQVGPFTYSVSDSEVDALRSKVDEENAHNVGRSDHSKQTITIDPSQGDDQKADTLLHEVLHAVWAATGLYQTPAAKHEEVIVTTLSTTLLDTLRRNPALVSALVGE
jgi:hypothetical protein